MSIELCRVYDELGKAGGYPVLVDRVWPLGVSKEKLHLDERFREVAPSTGLRRWCQTPYVTDGATSRAAGSGLGRSGEARLVRVLLAATQRRGWASP